ncbi:hypothetical protein CPC16_008104 [Podila verticillata]|nr:hypothetical protein CPC16_008104 [Podila verticillata]
MSIRLVSSARNLREQFKGNGGTNLTASSGASIFTSASGISSARTGDPSGASPSLLSRQGSLLRSTSNGNLRRSKSQQKKNLIAKVFADDNAHHDGMPDLSMEMTLVIVKRCVKEIRLTTKGILRQVQMAQSQRVVMDTIRLILDDDASTELSSLRQIDIHLIAHAMKWAIRYSEETLVTYGDYQALYLDQDRSFSRFVHDLPPTNRAILLDLFSLCADVTLLHHLNGMTLVAVAKAISLSIMAEPEREFTTFDASLQQRNMWGSACEDLLRSFLVIKTTHDLAKIEQEDEVDENRYVDNITRVVKSARQRSNENGAMPNVSVPTSASSTGWPTAMTPSGYGHAPNGYFDQVLTPRSASPFSQQSSSINGSSSLSRSHSLAQSTSSRSRPISPAPFGEEAVEYEQMMQDHTHLTRLRHTNRLSRSLRPAEMDRRRSSAGLESLYMLPVANDEDGYESEPDVSHVNSHASFIPDFADGLGWDFSKIADLQQAGDPPSLHTSTDKGVNRSNSSSSNGSSSSKEGYLLPSSRRDMSKQSTNRLRQLQEQHLSEYPNPLQRANSHQDLSSSYRDSEVSPPQASIQRSSTNVGKVFIAGRSSPSTSPQRSKRSSVLRRSVSLDPHSMQARLQKKSNDLRHDALIRDLSIQEGSPSSFSLESSPQDLERPAIPTRNASQGLGRSMSKNMAVGGKLEISVGNNLPSGTSELTPISNPSSNSSLNSPRPQLPLPEQSRTFEVVSRPKDIEVNVLFTPITPISPKAEMRSKFQESFSDRPMSPPPGYVSGQASNKYHSRSPTSGSSRGQTGVSPSSSKVSSPRRKGTNRASSPKRSEKDQPRAPLQQGTTLSGMSTSSPNPPEGKSKAAGFIRALSHKLRSKQSDDQLRPIRINNQVVGPAAPPSVSIQPPRLELSFLGDLGPSGASRSDAKAHPLEDDDLPPMSAPASFTLGGMALSGSGPGPIENWRQLAQDSLPVPSPGSGELGPSSQGSSPPIGYMSARRGSGTLFGTGNIANREQRRRSKNFTVGSSISRSPLNQLQSAKSDDEDSVKPTSVTGPTPQATLSEPSTLSSSQAIANNPTSPKTARGGEREYRFSTATLLKDVSVQSPSETDVQDGAPIVVVERAVELCKELDSDLLEQQPSWTASSPRSIPGWTKPGTEAGCDEGSARELYGLGQGPQSIGSAQSWVHRWNRSGDYYRNWVLSYRVRTASASSESSELELEYSRLLSAGDKGIPKNFGQYPRESLPKPGPEPTWILIDDDNKAEPKAFETVATAVGPRHARQSSEEPVPGPNQTITTIFPGPLTPTKAKKNRLFGSKFKSSSKKHRVSVTLNPAINYTNTNINNKTESGKKRPAGVARKDQMTKTEESLDEVFPWMTVEHMAGQESGWVMLEPVQDGAVGWVKIDKLEEEMAKFAEVEKKRRP